MKINAVLKFKYVLVIYTFTYISEVAPAISLTVSEGSKFL